MKKICLTIFLTICIYFCVFLATGIEEPQCFHFTWPGADYRNSSELDCEKYNDDNSFTPCIKPLLFQDTKPNMITLWRNINNNKQYIQRLEPGRVCVRYTYMYSGAVINVSYFHGKVTIDQTTAVTSGCYVHYTEGYKIEACACRSTKGNAMPCNSTIRNTCSTLIIFVVAAVSLFTYKIFHIP